MVGVIYWKPWLRQPHTPELPGITHGASSIMPTLRIRSHERAAKQEATTYLIVRYVQGHQSSHGTLAIGAGQHACQVIVGHGEVLQLRKV